MTARELQAAMVDDLAALFEDLQLRAPADNDQEYTMAHISVYAQELPYLYTTDEEEDPFPYIIVRLESGGIASPTEPHKVNITLIVGVFDNNMESSGHTSVLTIIERIQQHYQEIPALGAFVYDVQSPFDWALQDEPSFPYYFGACRFTFNAYAPRVRSAYS